MNARQHAPHGEPPAGMGVGVGGYDKSGLLADYVDRFQVKTLVETGIYQGVGSGMRFAERLRYVAVDYQRENLELVRQACPSALCFEGDSAAELPRVLRVLTPRDQGEENALLPVLFWLDAHAISEDEGAPTVCPVLGELAAIVAWQEAGSSVVLIDDLWAMGKIRGWPTLDELREAAGGGPWLRDESDGIMRLTPRL